ncbi:MAG: aspartate kinase [Planctomycetia bacterium]|nr:aspartate kinase [Planctomycetia bacterium]
MSVIVQKFGGTSVADSKKILAAARKAIRAYNEGHQVVMVVSAMGKNTDKLIALAKEITKDPPSREMDMLLSTGEQVSVALMAMAIQQFGYKAVSMTGAQIGIKTDDAHTKARIKSISTDRMRAALDDGNIVIAAGFQGVDDDFNITTLGRGGSDTTAVALAAVLNAESCEIYTDVDGVYTTDPRIVPEARRVKQISYDEMLEMASLGAGVMHSRSIEFAKNFNVPVHVRASYSDEPGTMIVSAPESESRAVCGAAIVKDEVRLTVRGVPDRPGSAQMIFQAIAARRIVMDMIVQNIGTEGKAEISFTIPKIELSATLKALEEVKRGSNEAYETLSYDDHLSKISIVGHGMVHQVGVAEKMFLALGEKNINIQMISTSTIKISVLVDQDVAQEALRTIHAAFELEKVPEDMAQELRLAETTDEQKIHMIHRLQQLEELLIDKVELDENQARITLPEVPNTPGMSAKIFRRIMEENVVVDMIVQSQGEGLQTKLSFTVPCESVEKAYHVASCVAREFQIPEPKMSPAVAKISLSGTGMRSHTTVASRMLKRLAEAQINIEMINTSEVCFSVVVAAEKGKEAMAILQEEFKHSLE